MHFSKAVLVFLLSTSKFLLGVGTAFAINASWGFSVVLTCSGGVFGVVFYLFIFKLLARFIEKKTKEIKVKFNGWRRFMIKLKQKGGLLGIAVLTPLILSIPVGIALSISLGSTKRRILIFHISSVVIWSLIIFTVRHSFGFDFTTLFK